MITGKDIQKSSISSRFSMTVACVCAVIFVTGCATSQHEEENMTVTKLEIQQYEPITRLAFVSSPQNQRHIAVVRNHAPADVSQIETAAGNSETQVVEH